MQTADRTPRPWQKLGSRPGPDLKLFTVRHDRLRNPRNGLDLERVVLESVDWVNVVALTPAREVVLVRQYRFGTGRVTTEVPGGMVDPGESPEAAARRELQEETGYTGDTWTPLGSVEPNPAFLDNRCHHFLVENARPTVRPDLGAGEDIGLLLCDAAGLQAEIAAGRLRHALALSALSRVFDLWGVGTGGARERIPNR